MLNSAVGQGKHKRSLEHLIIPKSKKMIPPPKQKDGTISKRYLEYRDQLKRAPSDQIVGII